jgi:hypothetical protein
MPITLLLGSAIKPISTNTIRPWMHNEMAANFWHHKDGHAIKMIDVVPDEVLSGSRRKLAPRFF